MVNKISLRHNLGSVIFRKSLSYDYKPYNIHIKKGIANQTFGSNHLFFILANHDSTTPQEFTFLVIKQEQYRQSKSSKAHTY